MLVRACPHTPTGLSCGNRRSQSVCCVPIRRERPGGGGAGGEAVRGAGSAGAHLQPVDAGTPTSHIRAPLLACA